MLHKLLQIKIEPFLKDKITRIALSKGLNVSSYVKMILVEAAEEDEDFALTNNGFTVKEERRLFQSLREGEKLYKKGKLPAYGSMGKALKSLDE